MNIKKFLFYSTALVFSLCLMAGCKDDNEPMVPPPTLGDIVATYADRTLKLTVNGKAAEASAFVTVVKEQDRTMTLQLGNVVPGVPVFSLPKSTLEVVSRSAYACNITGTKVDSLAGYKVTIAGQVVDTVLTATATLEEIPGVLTNVKGFYNKTYKGDMTFRVSNMPDPVVSMQRVYTSVPTGRDTSSIKLHINNFSFAGLELGNISIDTIKVLKRGGVYGFRAEGRKLKLDAIGEVGLDVYGTMVGEEMTLSLLVKAGPLVVNVGFTGEQATESTDTKLTITLPGDDIFEQPVVSSSNYTFKMWSSLPASKMVLTPTVVVPTGAVIDSVVIYNDETKATTKIDLQTAIDFSTFSEKSCVKYYVMPEDVRKASVKSLYIVKVGVSAVYTMEEWVNDAGNNQPTPKGLTNSNMAGLFLPLYGINLGGKLPVMKGADGAAEIRTFHSVSPSQPQTLIPGVTAGTLFNGAFALDISSTLKSTKFGELTDKEPTKLKITYKYAPGTVFEKTVVKDSIYKGDSTAYHTTEVVPNMKDSCSISAYLYEVASDKESLDGTNINTSPKVIMKAVFYNGGAKTSYEDVEIPFVATGSKTYDATKLYKLAIVCSSSKRGDEFMGAPGSLLTVKRLEVVVK